MSSVTLYTDGGCPHGNPGPGGYGAVLLYDGHRREFSAGFRLTTNNRMEIMAVIAGLEALRRPCTVTVYSDSQYVVKAISKGWARRWKARGWMRTKTQRALNSDLWERVLRLCSIHDATFKWLRGHAGHRENQRCHNLASAAASGGDLGVDEVYEAVASGKSRSQTKRAKRRPRRRQRKSEAEERRSRLLDGFSQEERERDLARLQEIKQRQRQAKAGAKKARKVGGGKSLDKLPPSQYMRLVRGKGGGKES